MARVIDADVPRWSNVERDLRICTVPFFISADAISRPGSDSV
jgi:hypothetical protein